MNPADTEIESWEAGADATGAFLEYFRCPPAFAPLKVISHSSVREGFFRFGSTLCFGKIDAAACTHAADSRLLDAVSATQTSLGSGVRLPFNPTEVIENLRRERYLVSRGRERRLRSLYYFVRPVLPSAIRRSLHQYVFGRRRASVFPAWPVDCSVEQILWSLMELVIRATDVREIPFIWFWPEGKSCAAMMTHDVEEENGAAHCDMLMDLDEGFGVKASFQLVPEGRYQDVEALVARIRKRGFETNIHDLDHDGRLYEQVGRFQKRARKINAYAQKFSMQGFRAGAMHRNQEWFDMLEFQYDMSVPTVAYLEPQSGGCCTVTPYFVGDVLELPLTTVQDHSLFFILCEHSIDLWQRQIEIISAHHGLISFIVHPDYILGERERALYCELLQYLSKQRDEQNIWLALPSEINQWWRERSKMELVRERNAWQIRGTGCERARLAYARIVDGRLNYRFADGSSPRTGESTGSRQRDVAPEHVDCGQ